MVWKVNVSNTIKVISDTPNFTLSYMKDTNDQFHVVTGFVSLGDNLYISQLSIDIIGSYIVKLSDNNADLIKYETLEIIEGDVNYMLTGTKYSSSYDGAYLVFDKDTGITN